MRPCWGLKGGCCQEWAGGALWAHTTAFSHLQKLWESWKLNGGWSQLHQWWLATWGYDFLGLFPSLWDSFLLYLGCIFYTAGEENWEINVILHCAKLYVFVYDGVFTREPIQKELWKKLNRKGWNNNLDKKHHRQCSNTIVRFTAWKMWGLCPNPMKLLFFQGCRSGDQRVKIKPAEDAGERRMKKLF